MLKLWPLKICRIFSGLHGGSHVEGQPIHHTIYRKVSKLPKLVFLDLSAIKFGRVVKNVIFYNI